MGALTHTGSIRPGRNAQFAAQLRGGGLYFLCRIATLRLASVDHVREGADYTVRILLHGFSDHAFDRDAKRQGRPKIVVIACSGRHTSAQLQCSSRLREGGAEASIWANAPSREVRK